MRARSSDELLDELERRLGRSREGWASSDWREATESLARELGAALRILNAALSAMERLAAEARAVESSARLTLADADPELRVQQAEAALRNQLRSPFGREAYVRLSRSGHEDARALLARHNGSMPTKKGDMAMRLWLRAHTPPLRPRGRPRKQDDVEALGWLRQIERLDALTGRATQIPRFLKAIYRRAGKEPSIPACAEEIKVLSKRIRAARKRRRQ